MRHQRTTWRYSAAILLALVGLALGSCSKSKGTSQTADPQAPAPAPTVPNDFTATAAGATQINLAWSASTDNVGVTGYRLERCTGTSCSNFAQIATPTATRYSDTGRRVNTTYQYRVRATNAAGAVSSYSRIASATTGTTENTPPTVFLSSAAPGPFTPPTSVVITASASDDVGVSKVEFYDGATLKGTDLSAPYSYGWSITTADAGSHTWTAKAYDAANNVGTSAGLTLVVDGSGAGPNVSINSTSQSALDAGVDPYTVGPVTEGPKPKNANSLNPTAGTGTTGYQVVAINDLGMHCGDFDTRVSSILPPFQVLLAQVIQKGAKPVLLGKTQASVSYTAASNANDPILSMPLDPATGYPFTGLAGGDNVYKTNFWSAASAYQPFYPPVVALSVAPDEGLPVPNVEDLYIGPDGVVKSGDEFLSAVQHAMPGIANPYVANAGQTAEEYYVNKPFFVDFPFGYVANGVKWFEGAGVPFAAFDDFGRENPYPLVRVQAKNSTGTVLATVDTVLPISGEASCKNCHGAPVDVPDALHPGVANQKLIAAGLPVADSTDDPLVGTSVPPSVSAEYSTDINVLRLHDVLHGAAYRDTNGTLAACSGMNAFNPNGNANCLSNRALDQGKPVVCQVCHYTPALDLAQVGPMGGDAAHPDADANGRVQRVNKSNSRVLHMAHAAHTTLFPAMPAPSADTTATGLPGNQAAREAVLEQTCYQCHPGTNTKCMRGAMADGGMVCQDCHGELAQVGNDFTRNVTAAQPFPAGADLTKRVPWANEPGCGSCHTGDATSNMATAAGTTVNGYDTNGNADGIRLIRAYLSTDASARPIVPANKRFAENTIAASFNGFANPGAGNQKLYRVSTGHGGVMCEGCHGATHAEWDADSSPLQNDNVTGNQLQGHSGTVSECSTCHTTSTMSSSTQLGPHGMHLVNDSRFFDGGAHKNLAETENGKPGGGTCGACHGADHKGTVLSRTPVTRTFNVEGSNRTVQAGDPVACDLCHSLDESFER
ncbi:MAG: Ig-like domain-containing protein [Chromatiaceae bacterium]